MCDDVDSDDDDEEDEDEGDASQRLAKCLDFRRFVITKCLLLMSGSSSIVKASARFAPIPLGRSSASSEMDEKTASTMRIVTSLSLGQFLFVEFCAHCYELERTSIVASKKSSSPLNLPLTILSLRAFTSCVRGMTFDAQHHPMSKAQRAFALMNCSVQKAAVAIPPSADGWKHYQQSSANGSPCVGGDINEHELALGRALLPILSLPGTSNSDSSTTHLCLFSELLSNSMYGEAKECCYLVSCAAEALSEPNLKEQLGVTLLRGFELCQSEENVVGVLGLDHTDESNDNNTCVSSAIDVAMKLNCGLDGNTHVPLPGDDEALASDQLRQARSLVGLPTTLVENWPERHQGRLKKQMQSESGMIGIATQVAWALSATL